MTPELCKQALAKVGDPNFLVNLVSRRVRQLTTPGSPGGRPLILETAGMGAADIALTEIIEDKMTWEMVEAPKEEKEAPAKKRKKST